MPLYEYYCRNCATKFTQLRPISTAGEPSECDYGHLAAPVLTVGVQVQSSAQAQGAAAPESSVSGGCACGRGGCGCGALN